MNKFISFLILLSFNSPAFADAIDDAFNAQNTKPKIKATVDSKVLDKSSEAKSKVYERTIEVESARAEEWRRAGQSDASNVATESNTVNSTKSDNYTCSLRCTDSGILNETKGPWMRFNVNASRMSEAQEIARNLAKKECTVLRHEWGGVDCKKN